MKKIILTLIVLQVSLLSSYAQGVRLNAYAAYTWDDDFDSYYDAYNYYTGTIKGTMIWGLGAEFMPRPDVGVELSYQRMDTKAPTTYASGNNVLQVKNADFDLDMNFIMLGGTRYIRKNETAVVEGFAGGSMGVVWANASDPQTGHSGTSTKFGWGLKAGANFWVSDKVAIKVQGQMLSAVQSMGGTLYFGTGGGGAGLSAYSTIYQWCLGGGLTFNVGKE